MGKLQSLQVLRFLAALGVAWVHVASRFGRWTDASAVGAIGVDVFFVLSGYVIALTARRHPETFLVNRVTRVLPPYYLFAAPWILGALFVPHLDPRRVVASLTLWPAYDTYVLPLLVVGWTLCFEVLFYACVWLTTRGVKPWLLLVAYTACWAIGMATSLVVFRYLGAPIILEFLAGVGLALWPVRSRLAGGAALVLAGAAIAWFAMVGFRFDTNPVGASAWQRPLEWGVPAVLAVFGAVQLETFVIGPIWRALGFLGDASYALYLTHVTTVAIVLNVAPRTHQLVVLALCVIVSVAAYLLAERPLIRWARRLSGSLPSRRVVVGRAAAPAEG